MPKWHERKLMPLLTKPWFGAVSAVVAVALSGSAFATEIVVGRIIPQHDIYAPNPPVGTPLYVDVSREDVVRGLTGTAKALTDFETGAIFASPPQSNLAPVDPQQTGLVPQAFNGSQTGGGIAEMQGAAGGAFAGFGGQIAGGVTGAVGSALSGLGGQITGLTGQR
jgi:hypothetical protein